MRLDEIIQQHAKTLSPIHQAEVFDFVLFLEQKQTQAATRIESSNANDAQSDISDFQKFLLDSPEMTDEEYQAIAEKREHLKQWT